ncbi:MAG: hypothetical protein ACI9U2_001840 [Bradymonadia bacterium]|jgi:hypothetical protein
MAATLDTIKTGAGGLRPLKSATRKMVLRRAAPGRWTARTGGNRRLGAKGCLSMRADQASKAGLGLRAKQASKAGLGLRADQRGRWRR